MNTVEQCQHAIAHEAQLRQAIEAADAAPLMLSLVHLTGDASLLERSAPFIQGGWSFQQNMPTELVDEVRQRVHAAIHDIAQGKQAPAVIDASLMTRMMDTAVGQKVPPEYEAVFYEETQIDGKDPKTVPWRKPVDTPTLARYNVVVIGAGFSGIGMGIKLAEAGIDYRIIEKNDQVGGTWYENTYPGIAVDTPNHFYSYSFFPNPRWSRYFARGADIQGYILDCVEKSGVREHIELNTELLNASYDEAHGVWRLELRRNGQVEIAEAKVLISAVGALNQPAIPKIPGLENFEGPVFHTARWRHDVDLKGQRVALVGTGASGIQVAPAIAPEVGRLFIMQRSPHWIIKHPLYHTDVSEDAQQAMALIPFYMKWFRFQLFWGASDGFHASLQMDPQWKHLDVSLNEVNHKLRDDLIAYYKEKVGHRPDLLAKVIPSYPPFGKRMLRDTNWFDMLLQPNVELCTGAIDHIEPNTIVMADGSRHEVDVIAMATGFQAARMLAPMEIKGKNGASLRDIWGDDDPRAYLGMAVPGFPNFFMLYGPNTNLAHGGSAIYHSECQIRYIMQGIRELVERGASSIECRQEPFERYNQRVDEALKKMVWSHPGVTSWYKNRKGRVIMNSPWRLAVYRDLTARLDPQDYAIQ